jgi:nitrate/nitrite-specific signal transduction histidine kinase
MKSFPTHWFISLSYYEGTKAKRIYFCILNSFQHSTIRINQTNQMHQSLWFIARRLNTAQHVSGILMSIIRSLSTAVAATGLPLERGGSSVVGRGRSVLPLRSNGKPEAATAVYRLLMMGMRMSETCWAVFKRRAIHLRDWCIWLVDLFECTMMQGLTNPKCMSVSLQYVSYALPPLILPCFDLSSQIWWGS